MGFCSAIGFLVAIFILAASAQRNLSEAVNFCTALARLKAVPTMVSIVRTIPTDVIIEVAQGIFS
jgi:hypothetical protein